MTTVTAALWYNRQYGEGPDLYSEHALTLCGSVLTYECRGIVKRDRVERQPATPVTRVPANADLTEAFADPEVVRYALDAIPKALAHARQLTTGSKRGSIEFFVEKSQYFVQIHPYAFERLGLTTLREECVSECVTTVGKRLAHASVARPPTHTVRRRTTLTPAESRKLSDKLPTTFVDTVNLAQAKSVNDAVRILRATDDALDFLACGEFALVAKLDEDAGARLSSLEGRLSATRDALRTLVFEYSPGIWELRDNESLLRRLHEDVSHEVASMTNAEPKLVNLNFYVEFVSDVPSRDAASDVTPAVVTPQRRTLYITPAIDALQKVYFAARKELDPATLFAVVKEHPTEEFYRTIADVDWACALVRLNTRPRNDVPANTARLFVMQRVGIADCVPTTKDYDFIAWSDAMDLKTQSAMARQATLIRYATRLKGNVLWLAKDLLVPTDPSVRRELRERIDQWIMRTGATLVNVDVA